MTLLMMRVDLVGQDEFSRRAANAGTALVTVGSTRQLFHYALALVLAALRASRVLGP